MHSGSIVLTIESDGTRILETPWQHGAYRLKPNELADFESLLERSDFGDRPVCNTAAPNPAIGVDGTATALEAVVDGKYRLVYFDFWGVSSGTIADALDRLFVFAASRSGLRYPVNPNHPTFRGY